MSSLIDRARNYLEAIPGAPDGQRDATTFSVACKLVERFDLSADDLLEVLMAWNEAKNSPPLTAFAVRTKLASARRTTSYNQSLSNGRANGHMDLPRQQESPVNVSQPAAPLPNADELAIAQATLLDPELPVAAKAREYLQANGIDLAGCGWGLGYLAEDEADRYGLSRGAYGWRYWIPVYDVAGKLSDVRRYRGPFGQGRDRDKLLPWARGHGSAKPYRWESLPNDCEAVLWCEGEKDCEALRAAGFAAVTNTCGAGSAVKVARDLPAELVEGKRFTLLFDHDDAGREASAKLAAALLDRDAAEVRVATWPDTLPDGSATPQGYDASDFTRDGGRAADVQAILDAALVFDPAEAEEPTGKPKFQWLGEFLREAEDEVQFLVKDLVPVGSAGFLAARPKDGKTWLAIELAISVAFGLAYLDKHEVPEPAPVLYVACEGQRAALKMRFFALARGLGLDPQTCFTDGRIAIIYRPAGMDLTDPEWSAYLVEQVILSGAKLVIIDVLRAAAPGIRESGDGSGDFAAFRAQLLVRLQKMNVATLMLHHFVKLSDGTRERSIGELMSGSGSLFGAADFVIGVTKCIKAGVPQELRLEVESRDYAAPEPQMVAFEADGDGEQSWGVQSTVRMVATNDEAPEPEDVKAPAEAIAAWIGEQPHRCASPKAIQERFDIGSSTLARRRTALLRLGVKYHRDPSPARCLYYFDGDENGPSPHPLTPPHDGVGIEPQRISPHPPTLFRGGGGGGGIAADGGDTPQPKSKLGSAPAGMSAVEARRWQRAQDDADLIGLED